MMNASEPTTRDGAPDGPATSPPPARDRRVRGQPAQQGQNIERFAQRHASTGGRLGQGASGEQATTKRAATERAFDPLPAGDV